MVYLDWEREGGFDHRSDAESIYMIIMPRMYEIRIAMAGLLKGVQKHARRPSGTSLQKTPKLYEASIGWFMGCKVFSVMNLHRKNANVHVRPSIDFALTCAAQGRAKEAFRKIGANWGSGGVLWSAFVRLLPGKDFLRRSTVECSAWDSNRVVFGRLSTLKYG